jgi:vancomycin permeability regulator SanA
MFKRLKKMILTLILILFGLSLVILLAARLTIGVAARGRIYSASTVAAGRVAIVFGAGLSRSGAPRNTAMLGWRPGARRMGGGTSAGAGGRA